jgi:PAS domain S-box-containing protein
MKLILAGALMLAVILTPGLLQARAQGDLPVLTQAAQVRKLTVEQSRLGYPVRLRGVITFNLPTWYVTFFHDSTAGIFLWESSVPANVRAGDLVKVRGRTGPGDFAPVVADGQVRVVGKAPLPPARRFSLGDLLTGQEDSQWVEVKGVVHSVAIEPQFLTLGIAAGSHKFRARISEFKRDANYASLIDAEVAIRGACGALFNDKRQLVGIQLWVPSLEQVHIERAAPSDPYALPILPTSSVMQFTPERAVGHRLHVQGVVTLDRSGRLIFLQDASGGVAVLSGQSTPVQPGDRVDAVGFPTTGRYAPVLEDGEFRKIGHGALPMPVDLTHATTLSGDQDAELVKIRGRLVDESVQGEDAVLTMQAGSFTFAARLEKARADDTVRRIPVDSLLETTGVWSTETDEYRTTNQRPVGSDIAPMAFRILLRSGGDIIVIEKPSWWTARRIVWLLVMLAGIVFGISLWVAVLRRQVEERTETIRATLESTADGILVVNSAGRILAYNRKFADLWRIPQSVLEARDDNVVLNFVLSELKDPDAFLTRVEQSYADHDAQTDDVIEFKDGRVFERHSEPQRVMGRNVGRVWGFRDITERRRAEEELHHSRQMLQLVLDNIPQRVFWKDRNFNYLGCNKPFAIDAGLQNPEEIIGKSDFELAWREMAELYRADDKLVMEQGSPKLNFEEPENSADGSLLWLRTSKLPLRDREGKVIGVIGTYEDITERKRAERALQERTAYLNTLIENNPLAIVTVDVQGRIKLCNPAFERLFLYPQQEIEGANLDELVAPPESIPEAKEFTKQSLSGISVHAASRRRRKDGSLVDVDLYGVPLVMQGEIVGEFALYQDISTRMQAEAALIEERHLLRTLMDNVPDVIYFKDRESRFTRINKALAKMFGLNDPAQANGKTDFDFFTDEHAEQAFADEQEIIRTGQPVLAKEEKETWPDGRETWVSTTKMPLRDAKGNIIGTFGISHDITARKRAEEALRASEEHFRSFIKNLPVGVYRTTPDGRVLMANPALLRMLGYDSLQELASRNLEGVSFEAGYPRSEFREQIERQGEVRGLEAAWKRRDGSVVFVRESAKAIRADHGRVLHYDGTIEDITERRRLEEQFRQAQKMEAVGRLAAGVAHDFNNLLTVVIGYSDLLLKRLPASDRLRPSAEEIKKAGEQAALLTRQLLAFSRAQVLQPQILDLDSLLTNAQQILERVIGEDIELVTHLPPGLGHVKADPGQIEQVILNLAVNARDAMPQGGWLALEAANVELDSTYARGHGGVLPGHYVMVAMSDNGIGMDAETQARIFEPFFTTKEQGKGTGLGLSMVYGIVKQSGGSISVYSEPGKGTTFKVYLPRVDQTVEVMAPGELGIEEPSQGSETILLVEDEEAVRSLAREVLESRGYHVLEAEGAIEALEVGKRHKDRIHLLLTDVVMPQMNGRELAKRLAPLHPETKVLYMSGYAENAIVHDGLLDQGTALLQKPFTADGLAHKLREVLESAGDQKRLLPPQEEVSTPR